MDEDPASPENAENVAKKVHGSVLDHFTRISNANETVRTKNSIALVKYLCSNANTQNEDNELRYALVRLVRGLGSSRLPAKTGFYSTLVTLLSAVRSFNVTQVLECVEKQLQTGDSSSKSETGDIYTGQILACGALIRSGLFLKAKAAEQAKILEILLKAGKKRSYLGWASSGFIADLLTKVNDEEFSNCVWPTLKPEVLIPWREQTLDSVYLLFLVRNRFPNVLKGSALKKCFGKPELLCEENMKPLCDVLLNIAAVTALKHPVYELISKEVSQSNAVPAFTSQLDQQLTKSNRHRLLGASIIIRNMLTSVDQSQIPLIIVDSFVKEMLRYFTAYHSNNYDQEFQDYMTKFFESLFTCLKDERVEDKTKVAVVRGLVFYPGTVMIEKITKTRILQQVVSTLKADGVKKMSKLFKDVVVADSEKAVGENNTKPWMNTERIYAAQLLAKLLSHSSVQGEIEWKTKHLKFLINLGIVRHDRHGNVGVELANTLRDIFYRALDQKFSKLEDTSSVLSELVNHLASTLTPDNYSDALRFPFTEEDFATWQRVHAIVAKLSAKIGRKQMLVFQILFLHMGLQLFKDKDMATASLNELFMCYERVKSEKKSKKLDDDPEWIEVVVDLFLNLLSHNSHLLRNVIGSVFPHLCKHMSPSSLHQILAVLDPKNEENPLSKTEDESESENENDEGESGSDKEESGSDSEDGDGDQAEFEENETVNDKLRMAIGQALGTDAYQTDEESIDLDEMSDSEGQKLDEALAKAFKQFKPNRGKNNKKQTKDEETLTHFRVRVLDLVEIYLGSEPAMLSCLEVMLPLLQLLEFTIRDAHQTPLQARVRHCLKRLTASKKFESLEGITDAVLADLLKSLLEKGTKSALMVQDMSNEISDCSIFLIRCSQIVRTDQSTPKKLHKKLKGRIETIVTDAIDVYFKQRDCLIPYGLFKATFQLSWDGNFAAAPLVFGYVFDESTRPFRRSQALELLKIFYLNNRLRVSDAETFKTCLREYERDFCEKVVELLDAFCRNPNSTAVKERFVYHVFNLLKAMAGGSVKNSNGDGAVDWARVGEKVREYRSHVTLSKDAKQAYNQLCAKLGIPNKVVMKSQTFKLNTGVNGDEEDDDEEMGNGKGKKHHRRKGITESKKLKKEARQLRIDSLSEGLSGSVSFSDVNVWNIDEHERQMEREVEGSSEDEATNNGDNNKKKLKKNRNKLIVNGSTNSDLESNGKQWRKRANSEQESEQQASLSFSKKKKRKGGVQDRS